jgi:hypothetical protein
VSSVTFPAPRAAHQPSWGGQLRLSAAVPSGALVAPDRKAVRAHNATTPAALVQLLRGVLPLGFALALTQIMGVVAASVGVLADSALITLMFLQGLRRVLFEVRLCRSRLSAKGVIN